MKKSLLCGDYEPQD